MHGIKGRLRQSRVAKWLRRKLLIGLPQHVGRLAMRAHAPAIAVPAFKLAARRLPQSDRLQRTLVEACEAKGDMEGAQMHRAARLRILIDRNVAQKNVTQVLRNMAELERTHRAAQFKAGRMIARLLVSEKGRKTLLKSARTAQRRVKHSAFLSHIISLCQAMDGDYRSAGDMLLKRIRHPHPAPRKLQAARHKIYQGAWRVVDLIAREQMDWGDETSSELTPQEKAARAAIAAPDMRPDAGSGAASDDPSDSGRNGRPVLPFKEHLLQGRRREEYLDLCAAELAEAGSISARLSAISDMLRTGIRHIPDYGPSYARARAALEAQAPDLEALFRPEAVADAQVAGRTVPDLCTYLRLARRLSMTGLAARIVAYLETLSERPALAPALWPAPALIARAPEDEATANRIMDRIRHTPPRINRDVQNFFRWAMFVRRYEAADEFYARMPKNLMRRHGLLYYVNILQRQARLKEALRLLEDVHGQHLANPSRVNPFSNYSLIKRTGELRFLIETAKIYRSVPQPKAPRGVVLIAPRNIDQLRRYPLMVLVEMKRRGWAVVPMVEGLLPREETGVPEIDVMIGAISPNVTLTDAAQSVMPAPRDFVFDAAAGKLTWGPIDLSHAVWEDAAINRRRYTIAQDCPELQFYLGGLADWTRAVAQVLDYALTQHKITRRPTACLSLFSHRLPDALFRFYCAEYGDPDGFFFLHGANGYQNYFTNFSTNVSQRFVLRNMTRHPEVRSPSFPLPDHFERYYAAQKARLPEIMERFAPITKVKRSTGDTQGRPDAALALDARIAEWRARGGRVACAFGKVVCDSGVPYDGGPVHANMKDWINHCVRAVQGSDTLLLIKPHPHELNNQVATFPTEFFEDLIDEPLGDNATLMGHRWFDMEDMRSRMDLGLTYNGTTAIELGIMGIPTLLAGHFAPIDYPIGHVVAQNAEDFEAYLRFEKRTNVAPDIRERAAVWLDYMASEHFSQPYRFHARPVTNKVLYPPYWFKEDLDRLAHDQDTAVAVLTDRAMGLRLEPGGDLPLPRRAPRPRVRDLHKLFLGSLFKRRRQAAASSN